MHSQITISAAATSIALLSQEQRRAAVGVTDAAQDTQLEALDKSVALAIAAECNVAVAAGHPPTLKQETIIETFRAAWAEVLILARRHDVNIVSVVEDDVTLEASLYLVDPEAGILHRLCGGEDTGWQARAVVVTYSAGFADDSIPNDLMQAASDFMRLQWSARARDPSLKSEVIDVAGVLRKERAYWIGAVPGQSTADAVPDIVAGQLRRYRNESVA